MYRFYSITPTTYRNIAVTALVMLTLIVFTGAAVRLTGSGLGCPDWPQCYGKATPPLETHAIIEYGNRVLSGLVGIVALFAALTAWLRRPFRRDLALLGMCLPLGVVGQAVPGGFTVRYHLAPGFVMGHYGLSMLIIVAAVGLAFRARHDDLLRARDQSTWEINGVVALGALAIFVGTAATAAGPHAGGSGTGDHVHRLDWWGNHTLDYAIHQHALLAAIFGVCLLLSCWRSRVDRRLHRALAIAAALVTLQGIVGTAQYLLHLPAEIVWLHVMLATLTWVALVWAFLERRYSRLSLAITRTRQPGTEAVTVSTMATNSDSSLSQ